VILILFLRIVKVKTPPLSGGAYFFRCPGAEAPRQVAQIISEPIIRLLIDHQRVHHIMLFVLKNVAMPHVLVAAGPWALGRLAIHDGQSDFP
jgi:hypothetical protein